MYLAGYGLGRAWIEGVRTDQLKIQGTNIPVSQMLSICLLIGAVIADVAVRVRLAKVKPADNKEKKDEISTDNKEKKDEE